ncbi:putative protein TPRXL [Mercenaria mercenaria]|uniref:putative protein TPRXL n=1 Tax=Mercenaria mercenaria TaxID=6596 RepID=UPI00234E95D2|nr:putative protein TPRXL [Mercenaria mercenaria]
MDTKDIENEGDKANKCTDIKESGKMTEPSDKTTEKFLTTYKNNGDEYIGPNGANVNFDKSVYSKTSSKAKTRNKNKFLRRSKSCQDMSTSKHKTIPHSNSFCAKPFNSSNRQASIPEIDGDEKFEAPHNNQSPVANESSSSAASIKSTDCEAYVPKKVPTFILNDLDSEEEPFSREKSDTENPSVSSASKNVNYVSSAQLSLTQSSQSSMESPILPIKSSSSSSSLDSSTPPTLQSVQTSVSLPVAVISPTPTPSSPCKYFLNSF